MKTSILESILPVRHQSSPAPTSGSFSLKNQQSSDGSDIIRPVRNSDDGFKTEEFKNTDKNTDTF